MKCLKIAPDNLATFGREVFVIDFLSATQDELRCDPIQLSCSCLAQNFLLLVSTGKARFGDGILVDMMETVTSSWKLDR